MNGRIKISIYPLFAILIYLFCVVKLSYINNFNQISLSVCFVIFIYLIINRTLSNRKYSLLNLSLFLFFAIAILSSIINFKNIDGTILFCFKILNIFMFIEYVHEINKEKNCSYIFYLVSLFLTLYTITYANSHPLAAWKNDLNFFIGSKFLVSYNAIATIIFYCFSSRSKEKNKFLYSVMILCLFILSLYTCNKVNCSTGIVGSVFVLLGIIYNMMTKKDVKGKSVIYDSKFAILTVLISTGIILFFSNVIVKIPIINYLIVNVFNKNSDLSGRLIVYENILGYFKQHILFGYGYNNVYSIFSNTMKIRQNSFAFDAQNAFLEYLLYFGLVGCTLFLIIIKLVFKNIKNNSKNDFVDKKYFILGFYLLLFLGCIEITYNMLFFLFLAFIASYKKKNLGDNDE